MGAKARGCPLRRQSQRINVRHSTKSKARVLGEDVGHAPPADVRGLPDSALQGESRRSSITRAMSTVTTTSSIRNRAVAPAILRPWMKSAC